jgi:uncharacterized protein (DUF1778 family)
MLAYQPDDALRGTKTVRMEQRVTEQAKALIEDAARLLGINASEFAAAAATKAARETIKEYQKTVLTKEDHQAFLAAWDATEPAAALVDLMHMHAGVTAEK